MSVDKIAYPFCEKFLDDIAKLTIDYMKKNNISFFSIFREDILKKVPRCHKIYELIEWDYKNTNYDVKWYVSKRHILPSVDQRGTYFTDTLSFNFNAIRPKIIKFYFTYNITWCID